MPKEFDGAAERYDLMCRLNPGYRGHLARSAGHLPELIGGRILDLCCGTGLSTHAIVASHPESTIIGLDASKGMLEYARRKKWVERVTFVHGDAMDPLATGIAAPFDAVFMAYGIRNVPDPDRCLENLRSVIKPGGTLVLHEYTLDGRRRSRWIWRAITTSVVIPLGRFLTGRAHLFRYLRESVVKFDRVDRLVERVAAAGFDNPTAHGVGGWQSGIVHTVVARNPQATDKGPASC